MIKAATPPKSAPSIASLVDIVAPFTSGEAPTPESNVVVRPVVPVERGVPLLVLVPVLVMLSVVRVLSVAVENSVRDVVEDRVVNIDPVVSDSVLVLVIDVGCSVVTVGPGMSSVTVVVRVMGRERVTVVDGPACTDTTVSVTVRVPDSLMGFGF